MVMAGKMFKKTKTGVNHGEVPYHLQVVSPTVVIANQLVKLHYGITFQILHHVVPFMKNMRKLTCTFNNKNNRPTFCK